MSDWNSISIDNETGYDGHGVYRILATKGGKAVKIPRFRKVDEGGVLVIGRTDNIERRRKQFVKSSRGNHGHSEGKQWWLVKHFSNFGEEFSLMFDFTRLKSREEAKKMERREIQDYFKKFLELSPLNSIMPKRNDWFDQLRNKSRMRICRSLS